MVLDGTGSVYDDTGWYLVSISWYCLVLGGTWSAKGSYACIYWKKWRFGRVLPMPDTQTSEYRATQLLSSKKHKLSNAFWRYASQEHKKAEIFRNSVYGFQTISESSILSFLSVTFSMIHYVIHHAQHMQCTIQHSLYCCKLAFLILCMFWACSFTLQLDCLMQ